MNINISKSVFICRCQKGKTPVSTNHLSSDKEKEKFHYLLRHWINEKTIADRPNGSEFPKEQVDIRQKDKKKTC